MYGGAGASPDPCGADEADEARRRRISDSIQTNAAVEVTGRLS